MAWIPVLLVGIQPMEKVDLTTAASAMWAEALLQAFSSSHLLVTITYGVQHNFYFEQLAEVDNRMSAQSMFWGALMWLVVVGFTLLRCTRVESFSLRRWHRIDWSSKSLNRGHMISLAERCAWIDEHFAYHCMGRFKDIYHPRSQTCDSGHHNGYGSINNFSGVAHFDPATTSSLYVLVVTSMMLLWISQLLFWIGLVGVISGFEQATRHP
jgi:hypothetical protein